VICENWLGRADAERALLAKLGDLVEPGGVLVLTAICPVGAVPNVLRKALTCRLDRPGDDFGARTARLTEAFAPHLATLAAMTRTATDWVQDNVMNPAYFGAFLSIPAVLDVLGARFEVLGSSPRFATDWRWFKALAGDAGGFNAHFLAEYRGQVHNFLDCTAPPFAREAGRDGALYDAACALVESVARLERDVYQEGGGGDRAWAAVRSALARLRDDASDLSDPIRGSLQEAAGALENEALTPADVAGLPRFGRHFGRETVYLALESVRARTYDAAPSDKER
jgi:hypothetical protein